MGATNNSKEAFSKAAEGVGRLVNAPMNAAIEAMTFGSPAERIKQETRQGITDLIYLPGRVTKHAVLGMLKGTGKLLLAGLASLPIFPVWNKERGGVLLTSKYERDRLKMQLPNQRAEVALAA